MLSLLLAATLLLAPPAQTPVVATVGDTRITAGDVTLFLALRGLTDPPPGLRAAAREELIDRELVRRFLTSRKTAAEPDELVTAARAAKEKLSAAGHDPEAVLAALGVDDARFRAEFAVPLAWRAHVQRVVTDEQIRRQFELNRRRFDGSRLRVSQIFRPYPSGESVAAAPQTRESLERIRVEITGGVPFAEAARRHSTAPTAAKGGEVGLIGPRGGLPAAVSDAAFGLEVGGVSEPVLSPLGGHLVTVTAIEPGTVSLEDARPRVLRELADRLWNETATAMRRDTAVTRP